MPVGEPLRRLASCASTNDEAAAWARAGAPHGATVVADAQTRGRGRLGRAWHSPPGANLYSSTVLRPPIPPRRAPPITLAAAVAVAEAIAAEGLAPELKWPNDALVDGRKVAGILTEMTATVEAVAFVVVGIGVNLNQRDFPDELAARATSLARELGRAVDRDAFAARLYARLGEWYDRFIAGGPAPVAAAWKRHARLFGRTVTVDNGRERITGVAEDLDHEGALIVRRGADAVRVFAGEVIDR